MPISTGNYRHRIPYFPFSINRNDWSGRRNYKTNYIRIFEKRTEAIQKYLTETKGVAANRFRIVNPT